MATYLRRELLAVPGVADVSLAGLPEEAIYVEPDLALTINQNIPPTAIIGAIASANAIFDAGENNDVRVKAPIGSDSVSEIASLSVGVNGNIISLADLASVERTRVHEPSLMIRHNGTEAFTIGIAGLQSENIVAVGQRVEQRLTELDSNLPHGVQLYPIYQQHQVVEEASNAF
jgi:multidrug efflux pump subunit AcrB